MEIQVRINKGVVWELVDDQAILVQPGGRVAYVLNPTAARIWTGLAEGLDVAKIAAGLAQACGRAPEWVESHLLAFLGELGRLGLLDGVPRRTLALADGGTWDGVALQAPGLASFGVGWFLKRIKPYCGSPGGDPHFSFPGSSPGMGGMS